MHRRISLVALVVRDYDEAIAFYVGTLSFTLREDTALSPEKRWVVVAPSDGPGTGILLARAATPAQARAIGDQIRRAFDRCGEPRELVEQTSAACHTGQRSCFFRAARDGRLVTIAEPIAAPSP